MTTGGKGRIKQPTGPTDARTDRCVVMLTRSEMALARKVAASRGKAVATALRELMIEEADRLEHRGGCGMRHHADDCDCEGAAGDR